MLFRGGNGGVPLHWAVSRQEGSNLGLALQHHAKSLWCSSLCGLLHFWHLDPWALQEKVKWPHFQQLWHWGTPGFMFVALMVAMYLLKLKEWLISNLALEPLWESQISNQIIAMSDLGEALMILGLATREIFENISVWLMKLLTSLLFSLLPLGCINGMPVIFRYNLD